MNVAMAGSRRAQRTALLRWLAVAASCCLLALACQRTPPAAAAKPRVVTFGNEGGAPQVAREPAERPAPPPADYLSGTHWPPAQLSEGKAWISCSYDYNRDGDGT